ncbi:MAG: ABC transporter permease [Alphaproteobacteria bacterium]|nr:ABC transporter permease [Alphaproteobacteria bacterium]
MTALDQGGAAARHARFWSELPVSARVTGGLLALALLAIVIVPFLPGYDPFGQNLVAGYLLPFEAEGGRFYLLGADALGRDIASRLVLAARVSLAIALIAVAISVVIGVTLGLIAGFARGAAEAVIMGIADLQLSIPRVLLLIAVTAVVGPSLVNLTLLMGLTSWVSYGRVARAMTLSLREREFVLSAITQGASAAWNIRKHMLPNVVPQMVIMGSFELSQVMILEASLSYLGLGIQPPMPSLGLMVSEGQTALEINPWLSILPGMAIFILVAGIQFLSQSFTAERAAASTTATAWR